MSRKAPQRIVITGVTRGLGRALVDRLIALGQVIAGCGRSVEAITSLQSRYGAPHRFQGLDVVDTTAVGAWAQQVLADGPVDFLLNNAALMNKNAPLWQVPAEEFDRLIDVNLKGVVNMIRAFVPAMIQARKGVIVNFSSGWGRSTSPEVAPYCCTKWGIEGLTQAMAQELPPGLAAVALNPGIIDTEMLRSCFGEGAGQYPAPAEWAVPAADYILELGLRHNGQSLTVPL